MQTTPDDIYSDKGQEIRGRAKKVTSNKQSNYLMGRLGLVIDGTGKEYPKIQKQVASLKGLGYETYMIFVNTSEEVAQKRNLERERTLDPKEVSKMWNEVQRNMGKYQQLFGNKNFIIVDNNDASDKYLFTVWKNVRKLVKSKITNHLAKAWIAKELRNKKR